MRHDFSHLLPLISILLLFSALSHGQAWSGILAPARAIDWTYAGIPGGIPSGSWPNCVTAACNTAFSTPTAANINSACAAAPNNTVVRIPAGSINLSASIHCNRSNVALRGAGPTQTTVTLNGGNILMGNGSGGQGSAPGGLGSTGLSTLRLGSTVLTVGSTSGMSAGQIVAIYEANPSYVNANGYSGNENATWCPSASLNFFGCSTRAMAEMVKIVSVDSGTQITIAPPGLSKTYTSGLTPQVFSWSTSGVYSYDGVENMTVNASGTDFGVAFIFCNFCWAKNLAVIHIARAGIYSLLSYGDEIRDSYVSASNSPGAPTEYGLELDRASLAKVENNIFFGITSPLVRESDYGNVIGYNYTLNTATDNVFPTLDTHRSHSYDTLYEGNVTSKIQWDFVWGSGSHHTAFRTYARGMDPNKQNYRVAVEADAYHRYTNVVGNVLGDPTIQTHYECSLSNNTGSSDVLIYDLGWANGCNYTSANYDATVESSLVRWGNWDAVTWKANGNTNGIRYCTGSGAGNPACTVSETANTDPTFPGFASPSTTFPASFYTGVTSAHPSCGTGLSFWKNPSTGTCPPYPPIGPDVACTTNCIANTANHAAMIPAQLCYANTAKDGKGFLTAFDANACYASDSSSSSPNPPSGLVATPH